MIDLVENAEISFVQKPPPIIYVQCGDDVELGWQIPSTSSFTQITWYRVNLSNIENNIATLSQQDPFTVRTLSSYNPAATGRVEFLPNAGIRITSVKHTDEDTIKVEVDYSGLHRSDGEVDIKVIGKGYVLIP